MEKLTIPDGFKQQKINDKCGFLLNLSYLDNLDENILIKEKTTLKLVEKGVIGHARQSKEDKTKAESLSINTQIQRIIDEAKRKGRILLFIIYEIDIRGSAINKKEKLDFNAFLERRKAFRFYMRLIIGGKELVFDEVICIMFNRVAHAHTDLILDYSEEAKIKFFSMDGINERKIRHFTTASSKYQKDERKEFVIGTHLNLLNKGVGTIKLPTGYIYKYFYDKEGKEIRDKRKIIECSRNSKIIKKTYELAGWDFEKKMFVKEKAMKLEDISQIIKFQHKYHYVTKKYSKSVFKNQATAMATISRWLRNKTYLTGEFEIKGKIYKLAEAII